MARRKESNSQNVNKLQQQKVKTTYVKSKSFSPYSTGSPTPSSFISAEKSFKEFNFLYEYLREMGIFMPHHG